VPEPVLLQIIENQLIKVYSIASFTCAQPFRLSISTFKGLPVRKTDRRAIGRKDYGKGKPRFAAAIRNIGKLIPGSEKLVVTLKSKN
jgi:hypothetical protein